MLVVLMVEPMDVMWVELTAALLVDTMVGLMVVG